MTAQFDVGRSHIPVQGYISGPGADQYVWFALDTAATRTVIRPRFLRLIGCNLNHPISRLQMTAAIGIATAPVVNVGRIIALGHQRDTFEVIAHDLPATFAGEGLLGLDFFQGMILSIDFVDGLIALDRKKPPRSKWWLFGR